jgi:uncharacterized RDD family membrane protein YckC
MARSRNRPKTWEELRRRVLEEEEEDYLSVAEMEDRRRKLSWFRHAPWVAPVLVLAFVPTIRTGDAPVWLLFVVAGSLVYGAVTLYIIYRRYDPRWAALIRDKQEGEGFVPSVPEPQPPPASLPVAQPRRRFVAWVADAAIAAMIFTPFNPAIWSDEPDAGLFFALWAPAMVLLYLYLIAFDAGARGATPGKRLLGLRVADLDGGPAIGWRRAAIRRLVYTVGGLALYIGWLWLFTNERRQAWHDKAARTVVVRVG